MINRPNFRGGLPYAILDEGEINALVKEMTRAVEDGEIDKTKEEVYDRKHATVFNHYTIDLQLNIGLSSLYFTADFETTVQQTLYEGDYYTPDSVDERVCSVELLGATCWDDYNTKRGFTPEQRQTIERRVLKCL